MQAPGAGPIFLYSRAFMRAGAPQPPLDPVPAELLSGARIGFVGASRASRGACARGGACASGGDGGEPGGNPAPIPCPDADIPAHLAEQHDAGAPPPGTSPATVLRRQLAQATSLWHISQQR